MRHGRERSLPEPSGRAARRAGGRHSKGRHAAAVRHPRPSVLGRLPLKIGVGLALASTTSFTAVSFGAPTTGELALGADVAAAAGGQGAAAAALADRQSGASRSQERSALGTSAGVTVPRDAVIPAQESAAVQVDAPPVLPGCDGVATGAGVNGQVPTSELCDLWDGYPAIRADAAVALARLNQAYTEQFGEAICITDGYRSYAQQVTAKAAKPTLTATPGTSNHGWGLAIDICADGYAGDRWDWLKANAPEFGWDNPGWAQAGGVGPYEPWHWEFTAAVAQKGQG
jgi:hypothetical protein